MLTCHEMTEEEKYNICQWKYSGEYAIYDGMPYEEQKKRGFGFANPKTAFIHSMTERSWSGSSICLKRKRRSFSESA